MVNKKKIVDKKEFEKKETSQERILGPTNRTEDIIVLNEIFCNYD